MHPRCLLLPALILLAVCLAISCNGKHSSDSGDSSADLIRPVSTPKLYNVIEWEDLGGTWDCAWPGACINDYLELPKLASQWASPITPQELNRSIGDIEDGLVQPILDPMPEDELAGQIADALNIKFLMDGLNPRPLIAITIRKEESTEFREREILFQDPYVGTFEGILLTPQGPGPFPTVLAVHGHRDDAQKYMDNFHGNEYPGRGYAILMLTMRGMNIDLFEHEASRSLLRSGFSLMGMRVYESMLGLKYLRSLDEVDRSRIGLIGHSGGSSTGNLTVRLDDGIRAYVSDMTTDYSEWGTLWEPWHCETVPKLFPYNVLISDFSTCPTPVKSVPYAYTNGMEEIFEFFDSLLKR